MGWGKKIALPWFENTKKTFLTFFLSGPGSIPAGDKNICLFHFFCGGYYSFLPKLRKVFVYFDVSTALFAHYSGTKLLRGYNSTNVVDRKKAYKILRILI